jgi:hypothetical protein
VSDVPEGFTTSGKELGMQIRKQETSFRIVEANGQPGAVTYDRDGHVVNVFALDIADDVVQAIRCVVNPDSCVTSAGCRNWP